jgi:DNA-binding response OmpR family regulator
MKKNVLIIDDSGTSLLLMEWILQNEGYGTQLAESVADGIALLKDNKPDLILLDLQMPDVSGFDFLKMRDELNLVNTPILIISALDTPENIKITKNSGASDFIPKPIKTDVLIAKVKSYLG